MLVSGAFELYIFEQIKLKNGADKTRQNYVTTLGSLLAALGDIPITMLTLNHITRWKMNMDSKGNQSTTIKTQLCHLRQVLKLSLIHI